VSESMSEGPQGRGGLKPSQTRASLSEPSLCPKTLPTVTLG